MTTTTFLAIAAAAYLILPRLARTGTTTPTPAPATERQAALARIDELAEFYADDAEAKDLLAELAKKTITQP